LSTASISLSVQPSNLTPQSWLEISLVPANKITISTLTKLDPLQYKDKLSEIVEITGPCSEFDTFPSLIYELEIDDGVALLTWIPGNHTF